VRTQTAAVFVDRFTHGLETRGGVREAAARRAASEANLLALEEQMGLTRQSLAALLGAGPDRGLTIARPGVALDHGFGLPAALAAAGIGRRPDVVAARLQAEAAAGRVAERRAAFYPNVNLSALIGVQSLGLDVLADSGSVFGSVGPAVSLPIFTGGRLRGELKGAEARYAEAVARYDGSLTQALKDVADAVLSQRALAGQLQKAAEAVDAAAEAHRVASDRYRGGLASYLEVLSAEDALLENVRALTDLRSRAFALDVALMRALGGGYETPKA
jgi:NodT family efflux transporter outer membrane factor (OMF) lipoprotein